MEFWLLPLSSITSCWPIRKQLLRFAGEQLIRFPREKCAWFCKWLRWIWWSPLARIAQDSGGAFADYLLTFSVTSLPLYAARRRFALLLSLLQIFSPHMHEWQNVHISFIPEEMQMWRIESLKRTRSCNRTRRRKWAVSSLFYVVKPRGCREQKRAYCLPSSPVQEYSSSSSQWHWVSLYRKYSALVYIGLNVHT